MVVLLEYLNTLESGLVFAATRYRSIPEIRSDISNIQTSTLNQLKVNLPSTEQPELNLR